MDTATLPVPPALEPHAFPDPRKVGMIVFLLSEVAFFSTLILAYVVYFGKSQVGPTPAEVLSLPLVFATTACLLGSSVTVHVAGKWLRHGNARDFLLWWSATIVLGVVFLLGTAHEWSELIGQHHLTISRNLFGTTYYTLVGFHAAHVTVGVIAMSIVLGLALRGQLSDRDHTPVELVSWYWHFVDAVWVVVFVVVYLAGQ